MLKLGLWNVLRNLRSKCSIDSFPGESIVLALSSRARLAAAGHDPGRAVRVHVFLEYVPAVH